MTETHSSWLERLGDWSPRAQAAALPLLFAAYLVVAIPLGSWMFGQPGALAAVIATCVCLVAGWLALVVTSLIAPPSQPAAHVVSGMLIRMSLPLFACLIITQQNHWLVDAGFAWFLVAAFGIGLAAETLLSISKLRITQAKSPGASGSKLPTSSSP